MKCFSADNACAKTGSATTCTNPVIIYKMLLQSRCYLRSAAPMYSNMASHISIKKPFPQAVANPSDLIHWRSDVQLFVITVCVIRRYVPAISGNTWGRLTFFSFGMQNKNTYYYSNPRQFSFFYHFHFLLCMFESNCFCF